MEGYRCESCVAVVVRGEWSGRKERKYLDMVVVRVARVWVSAYVCGRYRLDVIGHAVGDIGSGNNPELWIMCGAS